MDNIFEKISLHLILLKIFDIYFFCYLATSEKIAITHLWHAIEPQTMYHLIAKDKVAEQHISKKNSNCNTFWVMSPVLTPLSLGLSPQNQKKFQGHENSLGQLIYKKSVAVAVLEKSAWHTNTHTHACTGCIL